MNGLPAVLGEVVLRNIASKGCMRRRDLDLPASYAWTHVDADGHQRLFFIPKELGDGHYTQAQIEEIEQALACRGFDLLPLDYHIH